MVIKSVLFDFGDTLVVSREEWSGVKLRVSTLNYAQARRIGTSLSLEEYADYENAFFHRYAEFERENAVTVSDTVKQRELARKLFPRLTAEQNSRVAANMNRTFWRLASANWKLRAGTRECLRDLRSLGITMAVVSNHSNRRALVKALADRGIGDYFGTIVASETIGVRKPDNKIFRVCLSRMKVAASEAVFVGDSVENDVVGANAMGMKSILIQEKRSPKTPAHFVISDLGEIPKIVARMNAG